MIMDRGFDGFYSPQGSQENNGGWGDVSGGSQEVDVLGDPIVVKERRDRDGEEEAGLVVELRQLNGKGKGEEIEEGEEGECPYSPPYSSADSPPPPPPDETLPPPDDTPPPPGDMPPPPDDTPPPPGFSLLCPQSPTDPPPPFEELDEPLPGGMSHNGEEVMVVSSSVLSPLSLLLSSVSSSSSSASSSSSSSSSSGLTEAEAILMTCINSGNGTGTGTGTGSDGNDGNDDGTTTGLTPTSSRPPTSHTHTHAQWLAYQRQEERQWTALGLTPIYLTSLRARYF